MPRVAGLWVYPLKSARGIALESLRAGSRGLHGDRRWMVVDAKRRFVTQRQLPRMALLSAVEDGTTLTLSAPDAAVLEVSLPGPAAAVCRVEIWGQEVDARSAGQPAAIWLTEFLGRPCELVYLAPEMDRALPAGYTRGGAESVGFADAFHALLVGDGTLAELNRRLTAKGVAPVPLNRFRPNILISGLEPGEEDTWQRITLGEVRWRVAKPCERCLVTTVDQETGFRSKDREPLKTLQEYRLDAAGNALFGQNLIADSAGVVRVGDGVQASV